MDPVDPMTRKRMLATKGKNNRLELSIRRELHKRGLRYRLHQRLLEKSRRTVDVVFVRPRVAVFVDGCFWHGCQHHRSWPKNNGAWWASKIESNMARDRDIDARLNSLGWRVIRIWEHEKISDAVDRVVRAISAAEENLFLGLRL